MTDLSEIFHGIFLSSEFLPKICWRFEANTLHAKLRRLQRVAYLVVKFQYSCLQQWTAGGLFSIRQIRVRQEKRSNSNKKFSETLFYYQFR